MRILFLFLLPFLSFGQIHVMPGVVASRSSVTIPSVLNIQDITINVNPAQYLGTDVSITANANGAVVTDWKWRVLRRYCHTSGAFDTLIHETSSLQNPIFTIDSTGLYDVKLTARNSIDKYEVYEPMLFVVQKARFTREEADEIVDMSTGSQFLDYRGDGPKPGWKIWLEGQTTNGYLEMVDLQGTAADPVRIQKANDNTQVTIQYSGGTGKPWYFSRYSAGEGARHIIINGFNLDGTPGIKVTNGISSNISIRFEGKITDISLFGVEVMSNPLTIEGAAVAMVPTVASDCNRDNWGVNNLHVYRCKLLAGDEGVYINESNQSIEYGGNNGFNPPSGIGIVVARNIILGAGRDGIQVGSAGGEIYGNYVTDFGQQHDGGGQESGFVANSGFYGRVWGNTFTNGEMFFNGASGEYAYSPMAGQTTPQPLIVESNVYSSGTYGAGGTDEFFAIYLQNNPNSGAGNWNVTFRNNIIDTDNKCAEITLALGGYSIHNLNFVNNICIKTGDAGDTPEFNVIGNGKATLQSGVKVINNLVRERGSDLSNLYFVDYANHDYEITNLLSAAYGGVPTTGISTYDFLGFPIPIPILGYFFGPYSSSNKRIIAP